MAHFKTWKESEDAENAFCEKHGITLIDGMNKRADNWEDLTSALTGEHQSVIVTFLGNNHGNPWFALSYEKLTKEVAEEMFDLISAEIDENGSTDEDNEDDEA
jgi:hypothetical protein